MDTSTVTVKIKDGKVYEVSGLPEGSVVEVQDEDTWTTYPPSRYPWDKAVPLKIKWAPGDWCEICGIATHEPDEQLVKTDCGETVHLDCLGTHIENCSYCGIDV